jgi:hypothetical protein
MSLYENMLWSGCKALVTQSMGGMREGTMDLLSQDASEVEQTAVASISSPYVVLDANNSRLRGVAGIKGMIGDI